jgi:16S rRNA C967 or C1407 C5-methylase (RsmB/RsmF family)
MTRVLSHILRDASRATHFCDDLVSRLSFYYGARSALQIIDATRSGTKYTYIQVDLSKTTPEKLLAKLNENDIHGQLLEPFDDILAIELTVRDLEKIAAALTGKSDETEETKEEMEEKKPSYRLPTSLSQFKVSSSPLQSLPQVALKRDAAMRAIIGQDIVSGSIVKQTEPIEPDSPLLIVDKYEVPLAIGIALMKGKEMDISPGRLIIRVTHPFLDVPRFGSLRTYMHGDFSQMTLPSILAVKALAPKPNDKILIVGGDNGEMASYALELAKEKVSITYLIRNNVQRKEIQRTLARVKREKDNKVEILSEDLVGYSRQRKPPKFNRVIIEMPNSKTGLRPNLFDETDEKTSISYARIQTQSLRHLARLLEKDAVVVYLTHSIDATENQEVPSAAFRLGTGPRRFFIPEPLDPEFARFGMTKEFQFLPDFGNPDLGLTLNEKFDAEIDKNSPWLFIDPRVTESDAGFICTMRYGA